MTQIEGPPGSKDGSATKILQYRSPRQHEESTQYLAMVIFLCAWAVLYCGLFLAYALVRSSLSRWPPAGAARLPIGFGAVNVVVIGLASFAIGRGYRCLRRDNRGAAVQWLLLALGLGGVFLAIQAATWADLYSHGLSLDGGPYAAIICVVTAFQALQVVFGMGAAIYVITRVWRGTFSAAYSQPVRLWGMYWHSIAALWVAIFALFYLF